MNINSAHAMHEHKNIFSWWFNIKTPWAIIKIPIAILLIFNTLASFWGNLVTVINAFLLRPVFTGAIFLVFFYFQLPIAFCGAIFWGGLFYLPYQIFEEEKKGLKAFMIHLVIYIVAMIILLVFHNLFFGWVYDIYPPSLWPRFEILKKEQLWKEKNK